jgi:hypothetical protein
MDSRQLTEYLVESVSTMKLESDPFPVFTVDDILPTEVFHALRRSFPTSGFKLTTTHGYHNRGTQKVDQKVLRGLIHSEPTWGAFFSSVGSREFLGALRKRLSPHLRKERGLRVYLPWAAATSRPSRTLLRQSLELSSEFSLDSLGTGATIHPHRDASRKLVTLMFTLADDDWKDEWGGDTLFFRCKSKESERIWRRTKWRHVNAVPENNVKEFYNLFEEHLKGEYKPNRLNGMCASSQSYHAVTPIQIDENRRRISVRLTLEIAPSYTVYRKTVWRLGSFLDQWEPLK